MEPKTYLNFDLSIRLGESGDVEVTVVDSPAGTAQEVLDWPFSEQDLRMFVLEVGHTRRGTRRSGSTEMKAAKDFGKRLYGSIFSGAVGSSFEESMVAAEKARQGLRVRLLTDEASELADVPWEFLYSSPMHRFLTVSTDTPLVRYIDHPYDPDPFQVDQAIRVLTMVSSPSDVADLDVEGEFSRIEESLSDLQRKGLIELTRLDEATLAALRREVFNETYHVFHFIGHGDFDEREDEGVLLFEDDRGRAHRVSGEDLGVILHDQDSLRLVVLNSCEGARSSTHDPFGGTADGLVRQGIPAVIGMQFEITDEAAITFSHDFYAAIAKGYPVDAALAEARKSIYSSGNDVEWGTPVLTMRTPDGRIFERTEAPILERDPERAERLYATAAVLADAEQWQLVIDKLDEVAAADGEFTDRDDLRKRAASSIAAAELLAAARAAFGEGNWNAVIAHFDDLRALGAEYVTDPDDLEAQAREHLAVQERRAALQAEYDAAITLVEEEEWVAALAVLDRIEAADPEFPGIDQLRSTIEERARMDEVEQNQERAAGLYAEARALASEEKWDRALVTLAELKALAPQYPGADELEDVVRSHAGGKPPKGDEDKKRRNRLLWIAASVVGVVVVVGVILANLPDGDGDDDVATTAAGDETGTTGGTGGVVIPLGPVPVQLGAILPETGGLSSFYNSLADPVVMASNDINSVSPTSEDLVELNLYDSGSGAPATARSGIERLLADGNSATIVASTGTIEAIWDQANDTGTVMCSGSSKAPFLSDPEYNPFFVRTVPSDATQGAALGEAIVGDGHTTVAAAWRDHPYSEPMGTALVETLRANGVAVPVSLAYTEGVTDWSSFVTEVVASGADAVALLSHEDATEIMVELGVAGWDGDFYVTDGFVNTIDAADVAKTATFIGGGITGAVLSFPSPAGDPTFSDRFADFSSAEEIAASASMYDCLVVLVLAAQAAQSADPAVFVDAIPEVTRDGVACSSLPQCLELVWLGEDIDYQGASGPLDFGPDGEPTTGYYDIVRYASDGSTQTVGQVEGSIE